VVKGTFPGSCVQLVGAGFLAACWQGLTAHLQAVSWGTECIQCVITDEKGSMCVEADLYSFAGGKAFGGGLWAEQDAA